MPLILSPSEKPVIAEPHNTWSRSTFIKGMLGLLALGSLDLESCKKTTETGGSGTTVNGYTFGSGDIGVLNYLYMIEQIQVAFYSTLNASGILSPLISGAMGQKPPYYYLLTDIYDHQLAHCTFLNLALGTNALPSLNLDFSRIDFTSLSACLQAAHQFQNTEAQAYTGVSQYFTSTAFLTIAAQIGAVESRHSAFITGLLNNSTNTNFNAYFDSSLVDPNNGYEIGFSPSQVYAFYKPYLKTALDASTLPG